MAIGRSKLFRIFLGISIFCISCAVIAVAMGITLKAKSSSTTKDVTYGNTTVTISETTSSTTVPKAITNDTMMTTSSQPITVITTTTATTTLTFTMMTTSSQPITITTTMTTTGTLPWNKITRAGDTIVGIYSTLAGGSIGGSDGVFSNSQEYPSMAIDGSTTTKYLNFGTLSNPGINTGFYVIPKISNASIACSILFATANDFPQRDPITVTLEGSNTTSTNTLMSGSSWTLIYNGSTGINALVDPGRNTYVPPQNFSNAKAYAAYRLLITSKRSSEYSVQYSEAQIWGYI
ncbi:unnamed protein product [Rotaria sp. Silwood1]|nr:unnamed protein product [Rotaria sp. Silwood1]